MGTKGCPSAVPPAIRHEINAPRFLAVTGEPAGDWPALTDEPSSFSAGRLSAGGGPSLARVYSAIFPIKAIKPIGLKPFKHTAGFFAI